MDASAASRAAISCNVHYLDGCMQCSPDCPVRCWLERSTDAVSMPRIRHLSPISFKTVYAAMHGQQSYAKVVI